ncbi:uncharacterized protein LOC110981330 isoform X2 [Acanthaster planci]|uniref:Beta-1,4-galactosyltransferase n=1 Tax=Acanthaster planci TaxID=133434 RepID=A0A8B7YT38_ACAPL|nr:uncharacterized protein LOC110981330 isoform X2 [Acanthaster planci]
MFPPRRVLRSIRWLLASVVLVVLILLSGLLFFGNGSRPAPVSVINRKHDDHSLIIQVTESPNGPANPVSNKSDLRPIIGSKSSIFGPANPVSSESDLRPVVGSKLSIGPAIPVSNRNDRRPVIGSKMSLHVHEAALEHTIKKPLSECPKLENIPGLVEDRPMNLMSGLPMDELERFFFPGHPELIREIVSISNHDLPGLRGAGVHTPEGSSSAGSVHLIDGLSPRAVQNGDYRYLPGGHWRPADCIPRWKVAIVVPYRNRTIQLSLFLRYMIPFLQKQRLEFAIYIVNQANNNAFNRGMLLNVGYLEALKFTQWDCFIFHDVDHLPQSEFNYYGCVDLPRHFISGADNRNYRVPYSTSFGGVNGFTTAQFRQINGLGNVYQGWCCEDDDLELRTRMAGLKKPRRLGKVGYYKAISLNHDKIKTRLGELEKANRQFLRKAQSRFKTDGLNNLMYKLPQLELHTLYTNISVDIQPMK